MYFPDSFIEQIKNSIVISSIISKTVNLKSDGSGRYKGLCPFHNEKSPSFFVSDEKAAYHCFGCGEGGNIFSFIMKIENLSFIDTVKYLARELSIPLPIVNPQIIGEEKKKDSYYQILSYANDYFRKQINLSAKTINYLKTRNIPQKLIDKFSIGYAPYDKSGNSLTNYLKNYDISIQDIEKVGLVAKGNNDNEYYEVFRDRIIFPIFNKDNNIIGFGGRAFDDVMPKYLNSPETDLFKKKSSLYNINIANKSARKLNQVILVEGYMDVISFAKVGYDNVIAPLGTSITDMQIKMLWQLCHEPIICLDGDLAGQNAMIRVANLALPILSDNLSLNFVLLPENKDPDDIINLYGKDGIEKILSNKQSLSEVLWNDNLAKIKPSTPEQHAHLEKILLELAGKIKDKNISNYYRNFFKNKLWDIRKSLINKKVGNLTRTENKYNNNHINKIDNMDFINQDELSIREYNLIKIIIKYPNLLDDFEIDEYFSSLDFSNKIYDEIKKTLLENKQKIKERNFDIELNIENKQLVKKVFDKIIKDAILENNFRTEQEILVEFEKEKDFYQLAILKKEYQKMIDLGNNELNAQINNYDKLMDFKKYLDDFSVLVKQKWMN